MPGRWTTSGPFFVALPEYYLGQSILLFAPSGGRRLAPLFAGHTYKPEHENEEIFRSRL